MNKEPSDQPTPAPDRWEDIARYLSGESPPADAEEIRRWLAADPVRAELVNRLDQSLERLSAGAPGDIDVEAALARVKARFEERQVPKVAPRFQLTFEEQLNRRWSRTLTRLAAAVIVVLGVSVIWRATQTPEPGVSVATARAFTTQVGETDSLRLPDGTRVVLSAGSRLLLAEGYGSRTRVVHLNGEAFFDVEPVAKQPFVVHAGGAAIRDLGTAFVVREMRRDGVRVAVTEGSVLLRAATSPESESVVLRAGDRGTLEADGTIAAQRGAAGPDDLAFTSGRLVFEDASLEEISAQLQRWYGIELRVIDPQLAGRHITAAFDGETVEQVLNVIGLALGARIERNGDTAIVRSSR